LLNDAAKNIARRVYPLAKNGAPVEEAERIVRDAISTVLCAAKIATVKAIKGTTNTTTTEAKA